MNKWYLAVRRVLREMYSKSLDARKAWAEGDEASAQLVQACLRKDYQRLEELWKETAEESVPTNLGRHIYFGLATDVEDILRNDLPQLGEVLDELLDAATEKTGYEGFRRLLHPAIVKNSYDLFLAGDLRDAVVNSVVAVFDLIRERTHLTLDGSHLVNRAFSLSDPYLILSELETDSGQNDQQGFIQTFSGSYQGIRCPKVHSLGHDLTEIEASQYLFHASLLARRVAEAQVRKVEPHKAESMSPPDRPKPTPWRLPDLKVK